MKKKDYHHARYDNPHRPENRRERRGLILRTAILAIGASTVTASLYWILFSGAFAVNDIVINGAQRTDVLEARAYLEALLTRRRALVLSPAQSLFLVDKLYLEERLRERFVLAEAAIIPIVPHTLTVNLVERAPSFVLRTPHESYLIDNEGTLIGTLLEDNQPGDSLTVLTAPTVRSTTTGDRLFDASAMAFLRAIQASFPSITQGYRITELDLNRVLVHDITAKTSEQWVIYMTDELDPRLQFLNVDRALQEMKDERKKIQYIDVRLPNKIFYK